MAYTLPTTGTNPKTTTKQLLEALIDSAIATVSVTGLNGFIYATDTTDGLARTSDGGGFFTASDLQLIFWLNDGGAATQLSEIGTPLTQAQVEELQANYATITAAASQVSEDAAQVALDAAQTALDRAATGADVVAAGNAVTDAESARDATLAAALTAGLYVNTTLDAAKAAGLSAVAEGETFYATGADVDYIGFYKDVAGSAVEQPARFPKTAYIDALSLKSITLDRRSLLNNRKARRAAKSKKRGVIYITIGQSLSVRRDYTSGQPKVDWTSPHAYMVAGGVDRNAMAGVSTNNTAFNAAGSAYEALTQFVPSATQGGKVDGFAMMADVPTVCGMYAIGAKDYQVLRKGGTSLWADLAMFLSQAAFLLQTEHGCEDIEVVFSLAHGEAETDTADANGDPTTPTTYDQYQGYLREWVHDLTQAVRLSLDDLTYRPTVLVHQMAGVFSDPWRAIMEATSDFADEYSNVHLTGPTAPYGLESDKTHPPGEAQALMGEQDWHLNQRAKAGLPTCLKAHEFRRSGATITVPHNYVEGSVEVGINAGNMTDASGFNSAGAKCVYGVEVLVDGVTVDITSVTPSGLSTVIVLAADPGAATVLVRFGYMTTPTSLGAVPASVTRCNIRSDWAGIPSRYITTFTHEAWLLHDEIEEAI